MGETELLEGPGVDLPRDTILIGDAFRRTGSGGASEHINPATGKVQGAFAVGGSAEVNEAVATARAAFPAWRRMLANDRRDILMRWADLVEQQADRFNRIATAESGHPISFGSIGMAVNQLRYYAGWTDKIEGQIVPVYPEEALNLVHHEPYGVVAAITTWNGPVVNAAMKLAPALAAGNCVVLKPPELGPFGTAHLARLGLEAGLPEGVLNVVSGGPEVGDTLTRHRDIGKISFTGSVGIARLILKAAAENITPVVTELGGKSANLVFADADLDRAAIMAAHMSAVANAGQGCLFPTRLLVEDSVYDGLVARILAYVSRVKQGDPTDPETMIGPVISEAAATRIMGYIEEARNGGATLLAGGARAGGALADGYFIQPTVFGDVDNRMRIAREEVFGPVLSILRFKTEDEAVALANDTDYGLAGYVHTNDLRRAHRVAAALEAGYIGVNGFPPIPVTAPFGGWKQSGSGREGGRAGIEEFLRPKNVYIPMS